MTLPAWLMLLGGANIAVAAGTGSMWSLAIGGASFLVAVAKRNTA